MEAAPQITTQTQRDNTAATTTTDINSASSYEEEFTCAICLCLLVKPVTTKCKHNFCLPCVQHVAEDAETHLQRDNANNNNIGGAATNAVATVKCPLCRTELGVAQTLRTVNQDLERAIQRAVPRDVYAQRVKEYEQVVAEGNRFVRIYFTYGNKHTLVQRAREGGAGRPQNSHEWTCFLRFSSRRQDPAVEKIIKDKFFGKRDAVIQHFIQKVQFELDDTFGYPFVSVKGAPFELKRTGYGTFTIPIRVYWQRWVKVRETVIEHNLSFEGNGVSKEFVMKLPREIFSQK